MNKIVINLQGIEKEKVLTPKELQNLIGGSVYRCVFEFGECLLTSSVWDCWCLGGLVDGIGGC